MDVFDKIISGELSSYKLYEDDKVLVILDAYPNVDGHSLIIPKTHYDTLMDIPDELVLHINNVAKKPPVNDLKLKALLIIIFSIFPTIVIFLKIINKAKKI